MMMQLDLKLSSKRNQDFLSLYSRYVTLIEGAGPKMHRDDKIGLLRAAGGLIEMIKGDLMLCGFQNPIHGNPVLRNEVETTVDRAILELAKGVHTVMDEAGYYKFKKPFKAEMKRYMTDDEWSDFVNSFIEPWMADQFAC